MGRLVRLESLRRATLALDGISTSIVAGAYDQNMYILLCMLLLLHIMNTEALS